MTADGGTADRDEVVEELRESHLSHTLSPALTDVIDRALGFVVDGDWDRASETLAERFESVCERTVPELGTDEHPAACHLLDD